MGYENKAQTIDSLYIKLLKEGSGTYTNQCYLCCTHTNYNSKKQMRIGWKTNENHEFKICNRTNSNPVRRAPTQPNNCYSIHTERAIYTRNYFLVVLFGDLSLSPLPSPFYNYPRYRVTFYIGFMFQTFRFRFLRISVS